MHCGDEDLLAYLDGEVSHLRRYRIRRHLESCWHCRTRMGAAEQHIQQLTKDVEEWSFPGSAWAADGKLRLNTQIRQFEASFAPEDKPSRRDWIGGRTMWPAAAIAAMGLLIVFIGIRDQAKQAPAPNEAIIRAASVESALFTQPVQQTLAVEIVELRPVRRTRNTRLEVWADRRTGRFASKWVDSDGALKHAVWRSGGGASDFLYSPSVGSKPVPRALPSASSLPLDSLADYGLDFEQIESAFLRWLENGVGRPVSFTSDLAVWSHDDGTVLKAELLRAEGVVPAIRVTAQRTKRKMTAVLHVDFDAQSYRPRLQTIRFDTPERSIEFRLAATEIKLVSSSELQTSVLFPEMPPFRDSRLTIGPAPVQVLPELAESTVPEFGRFSQVDGEMLQAHYVLHQAGACLGEPVKIEQSDDGIRISSRSRTSWGQSFTAVVPLEIVLSAFAELRDAAPPLSDLPEATDAGFRSATALRHAWALSRLARHFPATKTDKLLSEHWRLLELMVRDHVTLLDSELERAHVREKQEFPARAAKRGWRDSSSMLFDALLNAQELLKDEPIAKIAPLLLDVDAELHSMSLDFSSEHLRSQLAPSKH